MQKLRVPLEIKALNEREFSGYGSVFGNEDLGGDVVLPGAFKRTLEEQKKSGKLPLMFWGHNPGQVPGKWIDMGEDKHGLTVKGVLADTPLGNEIHTLLKMEAVRGLSIGYVTKTQEWEDDGTRLIKDVDLWEVSIVSLPMNPLAEIVHAKTRLSRLGEYVPTAREFERILRDVGFSHTVAKRLVSMSKSAEEETAETVVSEPRDEDAEAAQALNRIADQFIADAITMRRRSA